MHELHKRVVTRSGSATADARLGRGSRPVFLLCKYMVGRQRTATADDDAAVHAAVTVGEAVARLSRLSRRCGAVAGLTADQLTTKAFYPWQCSGKGRNLGVVAPRTAVYVVCACDATDLVLLGSMCGGMPQLRCLPLLSPFSESWGSGLCHQSQRRIIAHVATITIAYAKSWPLL